MRILLTSTSFQDTPGKHHDHLNRRGFEIDYLRGPVSEDVLFPIIQKYDGVICGDDHYSKKVLIKGNEGRLKVISKYGIGLDKIDLKTAKELGIKVARCYDVNHITVAEHVFALILSFYKNLHIEIQHTKAGNWIRLIGHEIYGKTIGIIGCGRIGKEVALRAKVFGLNVLIFEINPDIKFMEANKFILTQTIDELLIKSEIVSLNVPLNEKTKGLINNKRINSTIQKGTLIVNTARGALVDENAIINGIKSEKLIGYVTDVLENEPIVKNHPFTEFENILVTPHIGSRTFQSVERQGIMAIDNLLNNL